MRNQERILFVGGQEDGKYHYIDRGVDFWRIAERKGPILICSNGIQPCKEEFKIFEYVRRGDAMYFN